MYSVSIQWASGSVYWHCTVTVHSSSVLCKCTVAAYSAGNEVSLRQCVGSDALAPVVWAEIWVYQHGI